LSTKQPTLGLEPIVLRAAIGSAALFPELVRELADRVSVYSCIHASFLVKTFQCLLLLAAHPVPARGRQAAREPAVLAAAQFSILTSQIAVFAMYRRAL
jgi:hypothetical protein